jgi:hypothetical protein
MQYKNIFIILLFILFFLNIKNFILPLIYDISHYFYKNETFNDNQIILSNDQIFDNKTKIIIYLDPHSFNINVGGVVVLVYIAQKINEHYNSNIVSIYSSNTSNVNEHGIKFNNFNTNANFDRENTIVIYPEQVRFNPLNAKRVIRWILAEKSFNVGYDENTWDKTDLVYYFNRESKFINYSENAGSIYKQLSVIFLNPSIVNFNYETRDGYCHTFRKSSIHPFINAIHPIYSFELTQNLNQDELIEKFNNYKYFVCYDPLSFLTVIAILCGCIPIVYPILGVNKEAWLKESAFWEYISENEINNLYGIAYGIDDLPYAEETISKADEFYRKMINDINLKNINSFMIDINDFENMKNTIKNNY